MRTPLMLAALVAAIALVRPLHAAPPRASRESAMARVGPGVYRPLFPSSPADREVPVRAFLLDRVPATNAEFLDFVRAHPEWRRDRVPGVFADDGYLRDWAAPNELGAAVGERQPVVRVSWFAAKAYCAARGHRLPTEGEWELAASASRTNPDGSRDPAWREQIVGWYSNPNPARLPVVGATPGNYWGVRDLHGLVWEWVLDYDGNVPPTDRGVSAFCGGGAFDAVDKSDYAAFMRAAFRSSLRAEYTTKNLGFRCAADAKEGSP